MKLLGLSLIIATGCVSNPAPVGPGYNGYGQGPGQPTGNGDPNMAPPPGNPPPMGNPPPPMAAGGCFAGEWKGGGDDDNHRHLGFHIALEQNGAALHGTFEYTFEFNHAGTEEVSGTADCARGTAELQGGKVTGDAQPTHYRLSSMPPTSLSDGRKEYGFEARWDCGACVPGTIKGYTTR